MLALVRAGTTYGASGAAERNVVGQVARASARQPCATANASTCLISRTAFLVADTVRRVHHLGGRPLGFGPMSPMDQVATRKRRCRSASEWRSIMARQRGERVERRGLLRGGGHRQGRVLAPALGGRGRRAWRRRRRADVRLALRCAAGVVGRGAGTRSSRASRANAVRMFESRSASARFVHGFRHCLWISSMRL